MIAPDITRREKQDCARRELTMRERVYPRWVQSGRMSQAKADREIQIMRAIAADYDDPDLFGGPT